jgi:tRNA 2-thiouridine synthesizing protein A
MKQFIDITRETCPMTFVKVKLMLAKLDKGDQLEVLLNEGEPLENVPRSCEEQGYIVLSVDPRDNGQHVVLVQK